MTFDPGAIFCDKAAAPSRRWPPAWSRAGIFARCPSASITGEDAGAERKYAVPAADSVNIDHEAQAILVRYQGHVFGMFLGCPHEHAAVRWVEKEHRFQCTKHDSRYQQDGVHISGRSTRNLDRFGIRHEGDAVILDFDRLFQSDTDPAGWAAAVIAV